MVLDPEKAIVMGGTWRIPVLVGLQSKNFVQELK
nr:MAG TPA: terminase large subunit [Caudoviricetes sp.]